MKVLLVISQILIIGGFCFAALIADIAPTILFWVADSTLIVLLITGLLILKKKAGFWPWLMILSPTIFVIALMVYGSLAQ